MVQMVHRPLPLPPPIKLAADLHSTTQRHPKSLRVTQLGQQKLLAVSAQGSFRGRLRGRRAGRATWHCCDREMDVTDTLWAFLFQGEGSPRRHIRACASLHGRLEKKGKPETCPCEGA